MLSEFGLPAQTRFGVKQVWQEESRYQDHERLRFHLMISFRESGIDEVMLEEGLGEVLLIHVGGYGGVVEEGEGGLF
ncbi:hypothetical protein ABIE63_000037 [Limibacillus sp. MBR-115]